MALDAVCGPEGSDARYFEDHPFTSQFTRLVTAAEIADMKIVGAIIQPGTKVLVTQIPGGRARKFES
jgi:hypothetical protein